MNLQSVIANFKTVITAHYMDFDGRTRRRDFWLYVLAVFVLSLVVGVVSELVGIRSLMTDLLALALLLPNIAIAARRLHDTGRSGWWLLLALIPILGWLGLIYFYLLDSDADANRFGQCPKAAMAAA